MVELSRHETASPDATSSPRSAEESLLRRLPIGALLPSDSPRLGGINEDHARVLAETLDDLPPILVHASSMRVIDGMHRLRAAQVRGDREICVRMFEGDDSAAFVAAVQQNIAHGLPLSLTDREAAAERIVSLFPHWSDRAIARVSGLSDKTVAVIRGRSASDDPRSNKRIGRDGRMRPVDAAEARRRASMLIADHPGASLRSVARAVGLSPATVRDVRERMRMNEDPVPARGRRRTNKNGSHASRDLDIQTSGQNRLHALEKLKKDPSLRMNSAGKGLLRWLEFHTRLPEEQEDLLGCVPWHSVESVLLLALDCSAWWGALARQLEMKHPDR